MNNKILVGSIIAVVILVLVSFTGVVGYQTTKSSTIARGSPLFSVRSKRAIDEDSKDLTCDYVGKGEEITISIPKRNDKVLLFKTLVEYIKTKNIRKVQIQDILSLIYRFKEENVALEELENFHLYEIEKCDFTYFSNFIFCIFYQIIIEGFEKPFIENSL